MRKCLLILGCFVWLAGCSAKSTDKETKAAPPTQLHASAPSNNPAAKYVEVVGVRVREKGAGKLEVTFGVVNHSEADLGDLGLDVSLRTTTAKPDDPPICSFSSKVPSVGPGEMKEVSAIVPTKLRVYELPDWQFIRPDFRITEPK